MSMNLDNTYQDFFLQMLKRKAEYQASKGCDSPSANYFWYRKRKKVVELFKTNLGKIDNLRNSQEEPQLFVELGCGEGTDIFLIREALQKASPNWQIIGLEGDPYYLEICQFKKKSYQIGNEVEFQSFDITQPLPFPNESVNVVYCSEVIEHIPKPEDLLLEIKRILRPDGYLLITTPNEPNVLQRSYWDRQRNQKNQEYLQSIEPEIKTIEGREIKLYGHISLRTNSEWDLTLKKLGFHLVDHQRGALFYGGIPFYDSELTLGLALIAQVLLDIMPKKLVRNISDQLIALYQKE